MTPEKIHLITNHFPIIGSVIASGILFLGLLTKNRTLLFTGLGVTAFSFIFLGIVMGAGEEAYFRYSGDGERASLISAEGKKMMRLHEEWAHMVSKLGYASLTFSIIGTVWVLWKKTGLKIICALVLILNLTFFTLCIKVSDYGGKIRRPDFIQTQP